MIVRKSSFFFLVLLSLNLLSQEVGEAQAKISLYLEEDLPDSARIITDQLLNSFDQREEAVLSYIKIAHHYGNKRQLAESNQLVTIVDDLISKHSIDADTINYHLIFLKGANFLRVYQASDAIEKFEETLNLYFRNHYSDTLNLARIYGNLANAYYVLFQYDSSGVYYRKLQSLLSNKEVQTELGVRSNWSLGLYYNTLGLIDSALMHYNKVLVLIGPPAASNIRTHISMNTNRSIDLRKVFRLQEAFEIITKNRELLRRFEILTDDQAAINSNFELALANRDLGNIQEAISILRKVQIQEEAIYGSDHINNAYDFVALGDAYMRDEIYDSAVINLNKALRIVEIQEDDYTYYSAIINQLKGDLYLKTKQPGKALQSYYEAYRNADEEDDPNGLGLTEIFLRIAQSHYQLSTYDSAEFYIRKSLSKNVISETEDPQSIPGTDTEIYSAPMLLENILLEAKLEVSRSGEKLEALCESFVDWRNKFDREIKNSNDLLQLVNIQEDLIELLIESNVKDDFLLPLIFKLHEQNQNKLLVNELEFKNARNSILSDSLRIILNSLDQSIESKKNELFDLSESSSDIETRLQNLQLERNQLLSHIKTTNPKYFTFRYGSTENAVETARSILSDNQMLIKFIWQGDELAAISLDNNSKGFYKLKSTGLKDDVRHFLRLIRSPNLGSREIDKFQKISFKIYDNLFGQLDSMILKKELIIMPDGLLNLLPFEALLTSKVENADSYKTLPYMIMRNTISYLSSIQAYTLAQGKEAKGTELKVAAFNPKYESQAILKWSASEIQTIASVFDTKVYQNENASKKEFIFQSPNYSYIHFAGHGIINDQDPMQSHLLLTQSGTAKDNRLTCSDIYKMDLSSEMIVLSACETGVGKFLQGEGMLTLSRGFFHAGAKSVVVSLWNVNDKSSSDLMGKFYFFLSEYQPKNLALRNAKLAYIGSASEATAHPYYWSGFVANGDMSQIKSKQFDRRLLAFLFLIPLFLLLRRKINS